MKWRKTSRTSHLRICIFASQRRVILINHLIIYLQVISKPVKTQASDLKMCSYMFKSAMSDNLTSVCSLWGSMQYTHRPLPAISKCITYLLWSSLNVIIETRRVVLTLANLAN